MPKKAPSPDDQAILDLVKEERKKGAGLEEAMRYVAQQLGLTEGAVRDSISRVIRGK